jgi:predicted O-methyltransferase YrrM
MSVRDRIAPDSPLPSAAHRAVMLAASRRPGRGDASSSAIARALSTSALGRFDAGEREWVDRIEERRARIPASASGPEDIRRACPHWSIPRVWGRFLMRLVRELRPASCMELGVGFGMSGAYQAAALALNGEGTLACLDQEEDLAAIAREGFTELGLDSQVTMRMGPIGETLTGAAEEAAPIDYAYIDAEHTEDATYGNFEELLPHLSPGAVVAIDDIQVDAGMARAWARIAESRHVAFALGVRRIGLVVVGG